VTACMVCYRDLVPGHPAWENERGETVPGWNPKRSLTHPLDYGERQAAMQATCSVDGCEKAIFSRGYCAMHKARLDRHGDLIGLHPQAPPEIRFRQYLDLDSVPGCWIWTGSLNNRGYGRFYPGREIGHQVYAHRWSYEHHVGPLLPGLVVMHVCDNPACVNPEHLRHGTNAENSADMARKERSPSTKLTAADVAAIRAEYANGGVGQRELAHRYGISQTSVGEIVRRQTWRL